MRADMRALPFEDRASRRSCRFSRSSTFPIPSVVAGGRTGPRGRRRRRLRDAQPAHPRAEPDEIIDPYHYIEFDPEELGGCASGRSRRGRLAGCSARRATSSCSTKERATLDRLLALDPLRLRPRVPRRIASALRPACCRRYRPPQDPRAEAITTADFEPRPATSWTGRVPRRSRSDVEVRDARDGGAGTAPGAERRWTRRRAAARPDAAARLRRRHHRSLADRAELAGAYGAWYRPEGGRGSFHRRRRPAPHARRLARRLDRSHRPGRCSTWRAGEGVLLDALRPRGREAVGLERDSRRARRARRAAGGARGRVGGRGLLALARAPSRAGRGDPGGGSAARPGGVLFVAVPNTASLQARAFGDRWLHLDLPRHLVHLPERSLVTRLRRRGLQGRAVSHLRGGQIVIGWLDGLVGMLPGDLRLYQALRRPEARNAPMSRASVRWLAGGRSSAAPRRRWPARLEVALGGIRHRLRRGVADGHGRRSSS